MAVETIKSTRITALESTPADNGYGGLPYGTAIKVFVDTFTVTETASSNGSTYRAVRLPSNARLVFGTARGDGVVDIPNTDVGVISVGDESVLDDDSLATALDIDDTGDHDFAGALGTFDYNKQMWEYTNATEDFNGEVDIIFSLDADAVAAGDVQVVVYAIVD